MKPKNLQWSTLVFLAIFMVGTILIAVPTNTAQAIVRPIIFPVLGKSTFTNDYNANRTLRGRTVKHHATDIIASKGQPLVAVVTGKIVDVQYPMPDWGYSVTIRDSEGFTYTYIHMNDDTPGTNDGKGGGMGAYSVDVKEGNKVVRGQKIGRVGDSGFSNGIPHLHFEIHNHNGTVINPYDTLRKAKRISKPVGYPRLHNEILPYGQFNGGINVAMGNLDGDQASEFITGAGYKGGPHVKVFDSNGAIQRSFFAYASGFRGGTDVATGDVNGDGVDEIITGAGPGGGPHIKVFNKNGTQLYSFFAYDERMRSGTRVAAGDLDGDGEAEVITGVEKGSVANVRVFTFSSNAPVLRTSFNAYAASFKGGADVATGDVSGDSANEIITAAGPGSGGGPRISIFSRTGTSINSFFAYDSTKRNGARVSVGNADASTSKDEILTMPATSGFPDAKMFSGNGALVERKWFLERWWVGGYDVGAGEGVSKGAAGYNRRATIRDSL